MTCRPLIAASLLAVALLMIAGGRGGEAVLAQEQPDLQPSPQDEDQRVVSTLSLDEAKAVLEGSGYRIDKVDADGDILFLMDGRKVYWIFYGEANDSVQIRFAWQRDGTSATEDRINEWNRTKRYSKAYFDHDGDPVLELDLDLAGGVTMARIKDFLYTAQVSVPPFVHEVLTN
jgi:hypothetical protein